MALKFDFQGLQDVSLFGGVLLMLFGGWMIWMMVSMGYWEVCYLLCSFIFQPFALLRKTHHWWKKSQTTTLDIMVDQLPTSTGEFAGFLNHQPYDAHGHVNFCTVKQLAFFSGLPKHGVYTFKGWKMKAHHKKKMLLNTYSIWLVVSTQLKNMLD